MKDDVIFTPLEFRNLTVKNRIFRSNISGKFDNEDGALSQTRINWECKFAKGGVGYVTSFEVTRTFLDQYQIQKVGGKDILEYWIPAGDLEKLNANIVGAIIEVSEFRGPIF